MTGNARGALRSSARLSTGGGGSSAAAAEAASAARQAARSAEAAALAARRRARALERAQEVEDSPQVLRDKCKRLADALRNAKHLVVYTGAGISTAADIPDYRGPRGVWTRLRRGETVGRVEVSCARPTLTHMALTALWARGTLKFVVSQNCDGLHLRAGLPRRALAELHGNMFAERCAACRRVQLRAFDTTERTARHAHGTRRLCARCGAELQDTIVHFGERGRAAWPLNWAGALRHAAAADVVLCLGSSLKVLRRYPRLWRMQRAPHARPALYIVNLQWTPKDAVAALKINARCDAVMAQVARRLRLRVPRYSPRADPLLAHAVPLAEPERHTTRRPLLAAHAPAASPSASPSASASAGEDSSTASDSDDELPLRRLAERIRASPPAPPRASPPADRPPSPMHLHLPKIPLLRSPLPVPRPATPPPLLVPRLPPPDLLHAFQVNMCSGDATILLRAQHAPSAAPPAPPRRPLSDLRLFRIARRPPPAPRPAANGACSLGARLRHLLHAPHTLPSAADVQSNGHIKLETDIKRENEFKLVPGIGPYSTSSDRIDSRPPFTDRLESKGNIDVKPPPIKLEMDCDPDEKPKLLTKMKSSEMGAGVGGGDGGCGEEEASALAAAIIARAVLLCRASLYPGLHTILAPRASPPPAPRPAPRQAECAWCARRYGARRCQWYGPPPADALAARVWRRVRGRRYLCACCGEAGGARAPPDADGGGWYGKGYRKGRRRRR